MIQEILQHVQNAIALLVRLEHRLIHLENAVAELRADYSDPDTDEDQQDPITLPCDVTSTEEPTSHPNASTSISGVPKKPPQWKLKCTQL